MEDFDFTGPAAGKKKKGWKVRLILAVVSLLVFFLILPQVLGLFLKDIKPIDDSDLRLAEISVLDSENAYFNFKKAGEEFKKIPYEKKEAAFQVFVGQSWDDQSVKGLIRRSSSVLKYFNQAVQKPKFQYPALVKKIKSLEDPENINILAIPEPISYWLPVAKLASINALYLARSGQYDSALSEAFKIINIYQKILNSRVSSLEYLTAVQAKKIGLETVQAIINNYPVRAQSLKHYINQLDGYYNSGQGLTEAFKLIYYESAGIVNFIEFARNRDILEPIYFSSIGRFMPKPGLNGFHFQPNATRLVFADRIRSRIKGINKPCGQVETQNLKLLKPEHEWQFYFTRNIVGKLIIDLIPIPNLLNKTCEDNLIAGATQTLMAIKAFKGGTGRYPATLGELVPAYLPSIPQDPFDGRQLKYSATKKIIYSVGKDMKDSFGSTGDDWTDMADPTFPVRF